uniref:Uncharacterized protein n=1 Tax=uncultured bacterium IN-13 TaxID=1805591 RepID=A0A142BWH9_9BACT|nr:hypothetical protein [uncultured bacterium IN-13]
MVDNGNGLPNDKTEEQDTGQRDNGGLEFGENAEQAVNVCVVCGGLLIGRNTVNKHGFAITGRIADFDGEWQVGFST